jgi:hypothetical protein
MTMDGNGEHEEEEEEEWRKDASASPPARQYSSASASASAILSTLMTFCLVGPLNIPILFSLRLPSPIAVPIPVHGNSTIGF